MTNHASNRTQQEQKTSEATANPLSESRIEGAMSRRGFLAAVTGMAASAAVAKVNAEEGPGNGPALTRMVMTPWEPSALFDSRGARRPLSAGDLKSLQRNGNVEMELSNGDALESLRIAVDRLKEFNGGKIPDGYSVRLGIEVNGRTNHRLPVQVPVEKIPKVVTPQTLRDFENDKNGDRALTLISDNYLAVRLTFNNKGQPQMEHFKGDIPPKLNERPEFRNEANRTRNHFFLELVPTKK